MRPINMVPAHVTGYNRHSIGICYEGGLDKEGKPADTRTELQKATLTFLLDYLLEKCPGSRICGHRDLAKDKNGNWLKECPCFDVKSEYAFDNGQLTMDS